MLQTFFFVPANNTKFISKASSIDDATIVYDLEDSISKNEKKSAFENLYKLDFTKEPYVRPNMYLDDGSINSKLLLELKEMGFKNFLIPKVLDTSQIQELKLALNINKDNFFKFNFILLIEHPLGLLNLIEIIKSKLVNIKLVALGNYDYSDIMGMKQTKENLWYARNKILNIAKAYNIDAIDIVSLNLDNDEEFCNEVLEGFSMGFDAKFAIHPKQVNLINSIEYYSIAEIKEARMVYEHILDIENGKISIIKINGKIYEKPHIKRIKKIINWSEKYESK